MGTLNPNKNVYGQDVPLWERGQHGGRTRPINVDVLFNNTKIIASLFNELNIKYCLSHGTMLGVYRDKDIIPWDDDVDLIVFSEDRAKLATARIKLRELGFYVVDEGDPSKPIDPASNAPYYDFVTIKDGEKVEGWIFDKIGDFYIYDKDRSQVAFPAVLLDTLGQIEWRGEKFNTPSNIEQFLVYLYGPNWKIPDKNRKPNDLSVVNGSILIKSNERTTNIKKIKVKPQLPLTQRQRLVIQKPKLAKPIIRPKIIQLKHKPSIKPIFKHKFKDSN